MRIMHSMITCIKQDRIKNEYIREKVEVASIIEKMVESRLRKFGQCGEGP